LRDAAMSAGFTASAYPHGGNRGARHGCHAYNLPGMRSRFQQACALRKPQTARPHIRHRFEDPT